MIIQWLSDMGPWSWMVLGAVLLVLEVVSPGVYLLWLGVAAIVTALFSWLFWDVSIWTWQVQVVAFLVLSLVSVLVGRRIFPTNGTEDTDEPLLNQRERQLIGRTADLVEPIVNGRGRVRLGDTLWRVSGDDMPAGTRVRVISAANAELQVVAAD
jgi:membrane protein implicated in regulation of membrane protease activity